MKIKRFNVRVEDFQLKKDAKLIQTKTVRHLDVHLQPAIDKRIDKLNRGGGIPRISRLSHHLWLETDEKLDNRDPS